MSRPDEEHAAFSGAVADTPAAAESSLWAPLGQRAFRWLWLGVLISGIGTTMQTVGAQWLLVDTPNAAAVVALVQAANTVPVMLLALPAGVLADSFDRRWLLFTVQRYFLVAGLLLVVLTAAGQMPAALLLAFTFALGCGAAVQLPASQAHRARVGTAGPAEVGDQAGDGWSQPGPNRRAGPDRVGHRPLRLTAGIRPQRGVRGVARGRAAAVATARCGVGQRPGAVRARIMGRRPVRMARARGAPDPAPPGHRHPPGGGGVGPAAAGRQPPPRPRRGRLRSVVSPRSGSA